MRLLLIASDPASAGTLLTAFRADNHAVDHAPTSADALALGAHDRVDVIVIDAGPAPVADDITPLRSAGAPTPILVRTDDAETALASGATACCATASDPTHLLALAQTLATSGAAPLASPEDSAPLETAQNPTPRRRGGPRGDARQRQGAAMLQHLRLCAEAADPDKTAKSLGVTRRDLNRAAERFFAMSFDAYRAMHRGAAQEMRAKGGDTTDATAPRPAARFRRWLGLRKG